MKIYWFIIIVTHIVFIALTLQMINVVNPLLLFLRQVALVINIVAMHKIIALIKDRANFYM
jgi:hypothetical protein